ncbi:MAG: hypothetical protein GC137_06780 [Alphaproteobacteria bacterium]|nr:hypothetical protein [Alphaproteobacteria bacterium]
MRLLSTIAVCFLLLACQSTQQKTPDFATFRPLPDNFLGQWHFLGRPDYDIYFDVRADGIIEERKISDNSLTNTLFYTVAFQDSKRSVYILTRDESPYGDDYQYQNLHIDFRYSLKTPERIEWDHGCRGPKKNWAMSEQEHREFIASKHRRAEENDHILEACVAAKTHFYRLKR